MLESIRRTFAALDEKGIQYCHWKSNEHLLPALEGDTDLDVVFLPEQRSEIDIVLNSCGLKRFRATPLMQYNGIEDYIGLDVNTAKIWHLHTHYRLTFGESHLKGYTVDYWGRELIKERILSEFSVYTSRAEDELVLLFSRIAMKLRFRDTFRNVSEDDLKETRYLLERVDKESLRSRSIVLIGEKATEEFLRLVGADIKKKRQFKKLKKALKKQLSAFTGYSAFGSFATRLKREIFWASGALKRKKGKKSLKPSRRVSPSGGCVVAFLGSDGAGKSTTIDYVRKEFSKKLDVLSVYLGSGDGSSSLIRKPMKLVAKKVGGKGVGHAVEKEYEEGKKLSFKAKIYSFAKVIWAMTLAKEKKKKLKEITKARNNGMLVLTDRYPQTDFPGFSDGPLLSKYLKNGKGRLYRKAKKEWEIYESAKINPPDLVIKLTVPTEIAIARKPEMTPEEIENKKKAVLAMDISAFSATIDTSVDKIESFGKVMNEIWKVI